MTRLTPLRDRLADLRRRRAAVRWGAGVAALGLAVLWTLAVAFVIDWSLEMSKLQRGVMIVAGIGVIVWAVRRYALPWLRVTESELDMALLVERQQKIDSDLVAALQFESPEAPRWGSTQLEGAVIDYVAEFSDGLDVLEGFSREDLSRRAGALAATVAILGILVVLFPNHAAAFLNRMLLGSRHYPTRTNIVDIVINDRPAPLVPADAPPIKCAYGLPLRFEIHASGDEPEQGRIDLTSAQSGLKTTVDLVKQSTTADGLVVYRGTLPKLIDSVEYELYLGDAWTDPAQLDVIPLPIVETRLTPTPPSYARGSVKKSDAPEGARQIAVLEGSRVDVSIQCRNKRLREAKLKIGDETYSFSPANGRSAPAENWSLDVQETPLARVAGPLRYEIHVVDEDGLQLEHPIEGFIRIRADQRPRIAADVVTRFVLPTAEPAIEFQAVDDYGLSQLLVHVQAVPAQPEETSLESTSVEPAEPEPVKTMPLQKLAAPLMHEQLPLKDVYRLKLTPLGLKKGDQLKVTLEAIDFRGPDTAGQSALSEPIVLQVTDESGVLAAISESDERSARQLDAIIQRQLGIGESK